MVVVVGWALHLARKVLLRIHVAMLYRIT